MARVRIPAGAWESACTAGLSGFCGNANHSTSDHLDGDNAGTTAPERLVGRTSGSMGLASAARYGYSTVMRTFPWA